MIKYLILDFGKVIAGPKTGNWHITPKFLELIDISKLDKELFKDSCKNNLDILSRKVLTLDEEENMFIDFYTNVFNDCNYECSMDIIKEISHNRVYDNNKFILYDNVVDELKELSSKYKLILLTDNWPSVYLYLDELKIKDLFTKIYISSMYGVEKKNKVFFDYPIKEFDIKMGDAIFIDDVESNLEIACEKGLDVRLMDRGNSINRSKYKIINNLKMEEI